MECCRHMSVQNLASLPAGPDPWSSSQSWFCLISSQAHWQLVKWQSNAMCHVTSDIQFFGDLINKLLAIIGDMYIHHTITAKKCYQKSMWQLISAILSSSAHLDVFGKIVNGCYDIVITHRVLTSLNLCQPEPLASWVWKCCEVLC